MTTTTQAENHDAHEDGTTEVYEYGIPLVKLPSYRTKPEIGDEYIAHANEINIPLLLEIYKFIKEHPKTWHQASWYKIVDRETGNQKYNIKIEQVEDANVCGTSFCFAGHVAIHEGFPLPPKDNSTRWERLVKDPSGWTYYEEAYEFSTKVLGLTEDLADLLYSAENNLESIEFFVRVILTYPEIRSYHLEEMMESLRFRWEDDRSLDDIWKEYVLARKDHGEKVPALLKNIPS